MRKNLFRFLDVYLGDKLICKYSSYDTHFHDSLGFINVYSEKTNKLILIAHYGKITGIYHLHVNSQLSRILSMFFSENLNITPGYVKEWFLEKYGFEKLDEVNTSKNFNYVR